MRAQCREQRAMWCSAAMKKDGKDGREREGEAYRGNVSVELGEGE